MISPHPVFPTSRPFFWMLVFKWKFCVIGKNVGTDRADVCFTGWTFGYGQSTAGLQDDVSGYVYFSTSRLPRFPPMFFWIWMWIRIFWWQKKCRMDGPHGFWLHWMYIWMWPSDWRTGNKLKFEKDLKYCICMVRYMFLWIWLNWWLSLHNLVIRTDLCVENKCKFIELSDQRTEQLNINIWSNEQWIKQNII